MAKYYINGREFKNQEFAKNYVRDYLTPLIGKNISCDGEHWDFLYELVKRHPEFESEKVGPGIKFFRVGTNTKGDVELNLTWENDEPMDISWITCVRAKSKSPETNLRCAMRVAIDGQIKKFKSIFKEGVICEECDDVIGENDEWQVDHRIHFEKLVVDFLSAYPDYPEKFGDQPVTNKAIFKKCDEEFELAWKAEHLKKAELRFLHKSCNLTRKKFKST